MVISELIIKDLRHSHLKQFSIINSNKLIDIFYFKI